MAKCVDQHHAFEAGLKNFEDYVARLRDNKDTFDGVKVRSMINEFGTVLFQHLGDEIKAFEELQSLGEKIDWKTWNKKVSALAVKTAETVSVCLLDTT